MPTISGTPAAVRPIGSSKYQIMGPDSNNNFTTYQYIPSFNDYLGYLQTNTPNTLVNGTPIVGYYVDYSGNGGYSGYVTITGTSNAYGMQISNIRVNTGQSAASPQTADPTAGTAASGTITIAANGASVDVTSSSGYTPTPTGYTNNGFWTDLTIASGASLINGDFATGPIIYYRHLRLRFRGRTCRHQCTLDGNYFREHGNGVVGQHSINDRYVV